MVSSSIDKEGVEEMTTKRESLFEENISRPEKPQTRGGRAEGNSRRSCGARRAEETNTVAEEGRGAAVKEKLKEKLRKKNQEK
jgi:hypothetical protein